MKTPLSLRTEAKTCADKAREIWKRHDGTAREHTAEELAEFDTLTKRADDLLREAATLEAREKRLNDLDAAGTQAATLPHNDPRNTRNGLHQYSLLKVFRQMDPNNKFGQLDGLELETHQDLAKRRGESARKVQGVMVPWDLPIDLRAAARFARASGIERRADLTSITGAGAIQSPVLPTMIELLRNLSLMIALGMRVLTDMVGNFSIPRQSGGATAYWIDPESTTITKSAQTIDNVAFSPKTLGFQTVYTRPFLHQTGLDAEMFVREDHVQGMAVALDKTALAGSGSGAEPAGILLYSGVNVVAIGTDGGAPTWAKIVEMERSVDVANSLTGSLAFVTSPKGRYKLKTTVKDSNTAAEYLWDIEENSVNGYPAYSTNQIPANLSKGASSGILTGAVFGDFTQAIMSFWGGQDVIVNPYTSSNAGAVEITTLQDADFDLRHPTAFSVIKDLNPA